MIRINLLPIKAAQKKELLQGQLVIVALVLLATAGVCGGAHMHIVNKVDDMQVKIDSKRAEISKLSKAIREVRDFEKRQKDLEKQKQ